MIVQGKTFAKADQVTQKFNEVFNTQPIVVRSPGRVNLIGEHTDYNNGFVLPAAINKAVYIAVGPREDNHVHMVSYDMGEEFRCELSQLEKSPLHWPDYVSGVIQQLQQMGLAVKGFNCVLSGDIPLGAGMSSSAALECAVAFALNTLFQLGLDRLSIVKLAQKAENEFVGVQCGIMDQFASVFGKKDHVIRLDCRSLEYQYVPFAMEGIKIVLFDTAVKHSLASSEYNTRRQQCEAGVAMISAVYPEVKSLRDATPDMLRECVAAKDELIYRRCKYVVEENIRLTQACEDLTRNDLAAFGQKMFATHEGLRSDYEVSCKELDFLVDQVKEVPAVLGSRMMGGGFGGCTINLVKEDAIPELVEQMRRVYYQEMNKELNTYITQIENGTSLVE